ncbi:hypothetical protein K7X08_001260 [Anisodus acutangulus]|uniref:Uncharacterized protein n=1 Tax=Anisodus acutangulus TaxID=402998 RepID=A0A9Q1RKF5_9SOLA|nr:hypothetical protein K7X08_001260 [Anisodus acutangulus]
MVQIVQDLPDEAVESTKEYLRSLIASPYKKDLLVNLQNRLNDRSDLTVETLSKCNKTQLQIFVAIEMGLRSFLSLENHIQATELIQIFHLKGVGTYAAKGCYLFIIVNANFVRETRDSAVNACVNEMFGLAKDVYVHCVKAWRQETLIEELDYVRNFFHGSEDFKDTDGLSQFLSSSFPASITLFAKSSFNVISSSNGRKGMITADHHQNDAKDSSKSDKMIEDGCSAIKEI